ncbi:four helix bundle protein [Teredinibacter turnerae]|uniref:four helix bundle protein n=1 Tax=Teredinibacter turnerae TaxID=2426 RepID=UPI0005F7A800|nr:four helix bundle protein [Teredinibacter turnerae]
MKFKKLDVWKESARLCVEVYKNLGTLRDYGFRDQITRSALSIPSNIAEGEERESLKDSIRFLNIAKGSTAELITQLYIGIEIGYVEQALGRDLLTKATTISHQLGALIRARKKRNTNQS